MTRPWSFPVSRKLVGSMFSIITKIKHRMLHVSSLGFIRSSRLGRFCIFIKLRFRRTLSLSIARLCLWLHPHPTAVYVFPNAAGFGEKVKGTCAGVDRQVPVR